MGDVKFKIVWLIFILTFIGSLLYLESLTASMIENVMISYTK